VDKVPAGPPPVPIDTIRTVITMAKDQAQGAVYQCERALELLRRDVKE
jgi:hypothetical protein